eukprot:COSAG05_NODE_500_length_9234_cov_107.281664_17_plen_37_part_00
MVSKLRMIYANRLQYVVSFYSLVDLAVRLAMRASDM